jgi:hypothetical protein
LEVVVAPNDGLSLEVFPVVEAELTPKKAAAVFVGAGGLVEVAFVPKENPPNGGGLASDGAADVVAATGCCCVPDVPPRLNANGDADEGLEEVPVVTLLVIGVDVDDTDALMHWTRIRTRMHRHHHCYSPYCYYLHQMKTTWLSVHVTRIV